MADYTNFKGTFTPHYEFAKPSGEDKVSIDVLNDNMDKLDGILYDIYSRLSPIPSYPVVGYTIPFEIPTSWFEDTDVGGTILPVITKDSSITNLTAGSNYKLTLYGKNSDSYVVTGTAVEEEGAVGLDVDYNTADVSEDIRAIFGGMSQISCNVINGFSIASGAGDYFTFYINIPEGVLSADIQAVIDRFYIEEMTPPPSQQFELIRADGEPVVAEGIELARNFNSTATMIVGDTYTVALNSNEYEPTAETVTIMDFSQMCEGAYGFAVSGGIFIVMFNAYATPSGNNLAFTPKENSIVAVGGGSWTSVVATPE